MINFKKSHTIESTDSLELVSETIKNEIFNDEYFEGKVLSNDKFILHPLFQYGPRNQMRPEIHVKLAVNTKDNTTTIIINALVPSWIKTLASMIFYFNILVFLIICVANIFKHFLSNPALKNIPMEPLLFLPLVVLVMYFIAKAEFNSKWEQSIKRISRIT